MFGVVIEQFYRQVLVAVFVLCATFLLTPRAEAVTVPVEVATGPSFFQLDTPRLGLSEPGPIAADQPWHFGWRLEIAAVIDRQWAREHPGYIPPEYRARMQQMEEVRYSPAILSLIPRSLIISPKIWDTGIYGATWEFMHAGLGISLGEARLNVGAGLLFTYAFMHSENLPSPFHFVRPGLDVGAHVYVPFSEEAGMSIGWDSHMYLPQEIGGGVFEFGGDNGTLWHIGEAFVMFHYIFPYTGSF